MKLNMYNNNKTLNTSFAAFMIILVVIWGCQEEEIPLRTTEDVNITGFFEKNPDQFSEFSKVLELTGNSGFLGAYGLYTVFAPTNEAIQIYLQEKGVTGVENIDINELKDMVRFHILQDTVSTLKFTDGKLSIPTMYGQYLITGAMFEDGAAVVKVNRQANIVFGNILLGNGIVHGINRVLKPSKVSVGELIEQTPGYSIFTQALKETKIFDTLKIVYKNGSHQEKRWFTVLAQSDKVYDSLGIIDYEALKSKYSHTGDPSNPSDSLYLYVAYHVLDGLKYLVDLVSAPSHPTLAPLEVITTKLVVDTVKFNEDFFNGKLEKGSPAIRSKSDYSAMNGVFHSLDGNIFIKKRFPVPIYWDVADQPEIRKMTDIFRIPGKSVTLQLGQLKDVTWQGGTISYNVESATTTNFYYWDDRLVVNVRTAVTTWIEFKTPLIVRGRYKVWACYRRADGQFMQVNFNDEPLARVLDHREYLPGGLTESELEASGFKNYVENRSTTNHPGKMLGIIDVKTTDRHRLKLVALSNFGGKQSMWLDMIHFIPVDMDQTYPIFKRDGTMVDRP